MDYIVRGRMIGGFALVAYPAEYDNSGVMTFIVNQDGVVYEKDLGPNTVGIASNMSAFDPDQTGARWSTTGCRKPQPPGRAGEIHYFCAIGLGNAVRSR